MKERDRPRIESNLRQLDAWRASGLRMRAYCDAHGHSFEQWRAWRGVEQVWRAALGELPLSAPGFAQVVVGAKADAAAVVPVRITVRREGGAMQATLEVPQGALGACAALLREVLA